ncbi:hypothetical protein ACQGAO_20670 [Rhodococcus sp. 1.20]
MWQPQVDGVDHGFRVGSGALHERADRILLRHDAENVQCIEIRITASSRYTCSVSHELLGGPAHEPGNIDATGTLGPEECWHSEASLQKVERY